MKKSEESEYKSVIYKKVNRYEIIHNQVVEFPTKPIPRDKNNQGIICHKGGRRYTSFTKNTPYGYSGV